MTDTQTREMTEQEYKNWENRLRRMAERQGLILQKSRRRDPWAPDYGAYWLFDPAKGYAVWGGTRIGEYTKDLNEIEAFLKGDV